MEANVDISQIVIETDRLRLRPWRETDLRDYHAYASVPGVGEMAGWTHHKSMEETKAALKVMIARRNVFALVLKETNKPIGSLGFHYSWGNDDPAYMDLSQTELGFSLSKNYWGQGLMVEAVGAAIDYCFKTRALDALTCGHFVSNTQSKRVIEKCGFTYVKTGKYYARQLQRIIDDRKYIMFNPMRERKTREP